LIEELTDGGDWLSIDWLPVDFPVVRGIVELLYWLMDYFLLIVLVDYMGLKDEWLIDYCR
jgi:hypothetical protein